MHKCSMQMPHSPYHVSTPCSEAGTSSPVMHGKPVAMACEPCPWAECNAPHHTTRLQPHGPGLAPELVPARADSSLPGKQPQTNCNHLANSPEKAAWVSSRPRPASQTALALASQELKNKPLTLQQTSVKPRELCCVPSRPWWSCGLWQERDMSASFPLLTPLSHFNTSDHSTPRSNLVLSNLWEFFHLHKGAKFHLQCNMYYHDIDPATRQKANYCSSYLSTEGLALPCSS